MLFFILLSSLSYAQTDCIGTLEKKYEAGDWVEVADKLPICLETGEFSREKRAEGYLLLARTHLFLDDRNSAEAAVIQLLRNNPEFIPGPQEYAELVSLINEFRSVPRISLGIRGGVNFSQVDVIKQWTLNGETDQLGPTP